MLHQLQELCIFGQCVLGELLVWFSVGTMDGCSDRGDGWECLVADLAKSCLMVLSRVYISWGVQLGNFEATTGGGIKSKLMQTFLKTLAPFRSRTFAIRT